MVLVHLDQIAQCTYFVISGKRSVFINVGRANVINDTSLIEALDKNWLSGAILDVFHQEPLPQAHAFWSHPKMILTPHVSALSRPQDIAECFENNLRNYIKHEPLQNLVNWEECY